LRTEASATNTNDSVPAISMNMRDGPELSAHTPANAEATPPILPNESAVPTPVARMAAG